MSLESDAMDWLNTTESEEAPKGWYATNEIMITKKLAYSTMKIRLDKFVKDKVLPPSKKYKNNGKWTTYYHIAAMKKIPKDTR